MEYGSVVFDMDGVILDFTGENFKWKYEAVRDVLRKSGINPEGLDRDELDAFLGDKGVQECVDKCETYEIDPRETWALIAERTTEIRRRKIRKNEFKLYPEVPDVLEELHLMNIEIGLISNAPEGAVKATVENYDLEKYFKFFRGINGFSDLPRRKPHPDHLEMAKAELKRSPFIYAGDAESDLLAAKKADMDSAWVKRDEKQINSNPDLKVKNLEELLRKIE